MSTSILNEETIREVPQQSLQDTTAAEPAERSMSELSDLVDIYAVAEYLPPADWVTRLSLVKPRRDVMMSR